MTAALFGVVEGVHNPEHAGLVGTRHRDGAELVALDHDEELDPDAVDFGLDDRLVGIDVLFAQYPSPHPPLDVLCQLRKGLAAASLDMDAERGVPVRGYQLAAAVFRHGFPAVRDVEREPGEVGSKRPHDGERRNGHRKTARKTEHRENFFHQKASFF